MEGPSMSCAWSVQFSPASREDVINKGFCSSSKMKDSSLVTDSGSLQVRLALTVACIDYGPDVSHSFSIKSAMAAGRHGLLQATITTIRHWSSLEYLLYIWLSGQQLTTVSKLISWRHSGGTIFSIAICYHHIILQLLAWYYSSLCVGYSSMRSKFVYCIAWIESHPMPVQ